MVVDSHKLWIGRSVLGCNWYHRRSDLGSLILTTSLTAMATNLFLGCSAKHATDGSGRCCSAVCFCCFVFFCFLLAPFLGAIL